MVPLGAEAQHGAAKEVELHRHLGAHRRVDHRQLVRREDPGRIKELILTYANVSYFT